MKTIWNIFSGVPLVILNVLSWIAAAGLLIVTLVAFLPLFGLLNIGIVPIAFGIVAWCFLVNCLRWVLGRKGMASYFWVSMVALVLSLARLLTSVVAGGM